jgi:oxygen-dependent protoporphyrinogen oxidase
MTRPTVVVVGGGISGLVAARVLATSCDVILVESSGTFGGKLQTKELHDRPIDLGADSFITRIDAGERLCGELGLGGEILPPSANSAAIYSRRDLREMPKGIVLGVPTDLAELRRAKVVSRRAAWWAAGDLWRRNAVVPADALERARQGVEDKSVAEIFGPRLGREVLGTLVDPLLGGINASDVASLSLAACAPQLLERISGQPSVVRALSGEIATFTQAPSRPLFVGLSAGMGSLASALEESCRRRGVDLRPATTARSVSPDRVQKWKVVTDAEVVIADAVLIAAPAMAAAEVLRAHDGPLADELAAIPYASVVTACFSFSADSVPGSVVNRLREVMPRAGGSTAVLPGSGVLVPRDGRHLLTALTFTSSKWPRSAAPGEIVIRAFAGRHGDERAIHFGDEELTAQLLSDIEVILKITEQPSGSVLQRWARGLPQYVTGHLARVRRINERLEDTPTLGLGGAAFTGIGIPACIENAEAAAARIVRNILD